MLCIPLLQFLFVSELTVVAWWQPLAYSLYKLSSFGYQSLAAVLHGHIVLTGSAILLLRVTHEGIGGYKVNDGIG